MAIISTWQTKSCYVWKNYLYFDLNVVYVFKKVSLLPSANGATRSEKGLFLKWICRISNTYPNFLVLAIHYFAALLRSVLLVQALEQFPVTTERSGTLLTIMGTPLEQSHSCKFQATLVVLETFLNRSSTVQNCSITVENSELFNLCLFGLLWSRAEQGNNEWCSHHCQKHSAPLRRDDCGAGK